MIQRKQDHQEVRGNMANSIMKSLHPLQMCKQSHPPQVPHTVTVNYEGGVGGGDRLKS